DVSLTWRFAVVVKILILFWLQFWLQLLFCLPVDSLPHRRRSPLLLIGGGVLGEFGGDVGVALGLAELGVPEDLLYDPDVDALLQQEPRRGVPGVVDP